MGAPLRILHLEDDPSDAELMRLSLAEEGLDAEVHWVHSREGFESALVGTAFDVILADYSLPGYLGTDALAFSRGHLPEVPFIFFSGAIGEERAIDCLRQGARDYVLKDRPTRLVPVIQRAVEEVRIQAERRRARLELDVAQRRQRILLEAVCAAGVVPWALEGEHLSLGDSACYLLGLTAKDLPQNLAELEARVHDDDRPQMRRAFDQVRLGHSTLFECRLLKGDGAYLWTRWTRHRHPGSLGGIFLDIGEQHRLQEQLLQGQKMESLGALAGRVAHDFGNILQGMVGQAEVLALAGGLSPGQRQGLERIHRAGERAMSLIHQLRTFSHAGPLDRKPTPLLTIAKEVQDLVASSLPEGIGLEVRAGEGDPPVAEADPGQIHEVLLNLVLNARDALLERGGRIRIEVGTWDLGDAQAALHRRSAGAYAYLEVSDDGPGIPEDLRLHIFEPYFTTKGEKGTGLGLSVASGIAEAHGGWLSCESELGRGTQFRLFLPLADAPDATPVTASVFRMRRDSS